jgi:hypothetical protein
MFGRKASNPLKKIVQIILQALVERGVRVTTRLHLARDSFVCFWLTPLARAAVGSPRTLFLSQQTHDCGPRHISAALVGYAVAGCFGSEKGGSHDGSDTHQGLVYPGGPFL